MTDISVGTIARSILLIVALFNQILAMTGKEILDIAENDIYQLVSLVFTIITSTIAWWKNNSFTENAIKADEYQDELKKLYY